MEKGYIIRQAKLLDLDEIANLEKLCFSEEEAASKAAFFERLSIYANHFWLLEKDGHIISMVNGMVTDYKDLRDEMYHNAELHNEQGKWQMIFGVETHPKYQHKGYAAILLNKMIEDAKLHSRSGVVLTCKEHLIHYYEKFGFENEGISGSEHGGVVWHQMRLKLSGKYSNMKLYRKKQKLTQMKLAELADLSVDSIKRIEGGQNGLKVRKTSNENKTKNT